MEHTSNITATKKKINSVKEIFGLNQLTYQHSVTFSLRPKNLISSSDCRSTTPIYLLTPNGYQRIIPQQLTPCALVKNTNADGNP